MNLPSEPSNQELMREALVSLKGKWGLAFAAALIYAMIMVVTHSIPFLGVIISIFITGAMNLGWSLFALSIAREEKPSLLSIFFGFQRFWLAFRTHLLYILFVALWSILLVIPGIVALLSYSQAYFILADDEDCGALEAITRSKEMMIGHRWRLFNLFLRFIGWMLVCILTFGIGFLLLIPYMTISLAHFYEDLAYGPEQIEPPSVPVENLEAQQDITEKIIERVMAIDQTIKDRGKLKLEVESTIAALDNMVDLSKEEIEKIASEVLEEEKKKQKIPVR